MPSCRRVFNPMLYLTINSDLVSVVEIRKCFSNFMISIIVSEYDQEIPQSQTADSHVAPPGRATQPPRDTRKTN